MDFLEKTGKTVEEALQAGLAELGLPPERVEVEVLEEASKGLFGLIGGKPARVRITVKKLYVADLARDFLDKVIKAMGIDVTIEMSKRDEGVFFSLRGENLGMLIGKHGQTLDALQYLTNLAAHRDADDKARVIIDVEDYRKRRAEALTSLAQRIASQVKRRGERVVLEPMTPNERKVIHMALQDDPRISTYSDGEEPYRKVIIALKRQ
ncbi:MAG: single-stranded nucleic acid binding protein [Anaerosporomusa subterranea]|jgi:spoIIIJ-associated protein|nr:single-stranded nucleic acid binding protein [Anaerosporomusa subterranea]